ncbi:hypothetical protein B9Z19DRAFT_260820 [Tuber borchii]|uniref:Uncharacterized protein n=1 Tax=Tuber borchii TaxID=42251 RepID=A0A2T6ZLB5_TUBBO|nr:hypothetical protein B9Z19DRAFT_260820 [Tuber borchii]
MHSSAIVYMKLNRVVYRCSMQDFLPYFSAMVHLIFPRAQRGFFFPFPIPRMEYRVTGIITNRCSSTKNYRP